MRSTDRRVLPPKRANLTETDVVTFVQSLAGSPRAASQGKWQKSADKSQMDGTQSCTLQIQGKKKIAGWLRDGMAHLVLHVGKDDVRLHLHSEVSLYSSYTSRAGDYTPVKIRFDQGLQSR